MLQRGIPSVVLATKRFVELARATFKSRWLAAEPVVVLPETEQTEYGSRDAMEVIARRALTDVLNLLAPASTGKSIPARAD